MTDTQQFKKGDTVAIRPMVHRVYNEPVQTYENRKIPIQSLQTKLGTVKPRKFEYKKDEYSLLGEVVKICKKSERIKVNTNRCIRLEKPKNLVLVKSTEEPKKKVTKKKANRK